jgi:hypothetical protein
MQGFISAPDKKKTKKTLCRDLTQVNNGFSQEALS